MRKQSRLAKSGLAIFEKPKWSSLVGCGHKRNGTTVQNITKKRVYPMNNLKTSILPLTASPALLAATPLAASSVT